jgi:hypothetical protein
MLVNRPGGMVVKTDNPWGHEVAREAAVQTGIARVSAVAAAAADRVQLEFAAPRF